MSTEKEMEIRCSALEEKCERLQKIYEALMNRVEHCSGGEGSSFSLFESNLLLHRQIKEHTSRLETINLDLQHQVAIRKKAEDALKRERDFISAVFDNADVMVVIVDTKGIIIRLNKTCQRITGYPVEELSGKSIKELFTIPAEYHYVKSVFDTVQSGTYPYRWESQWELRDRQLKTFSWSTTVLTDGHGSIEYIISSGVDITERKIADDERRQIEQRYRNLVEFLPQTVYERDSAGNFTFINSNGLTAFGYTQNDLERGVHITDVVAPADHKKVLSKILISSTPEVTSDEYQMRRKDGSTFPAIIYSTPIDSHAPYSRRRGIVFDITSLHEAERQLQEYKNHLEDLVQKRTAELSTTIEQLKVEMTERQRAEKALRFSERNYRELVQNANSIIFRINRNGDITFFNEFAQNFFGFSESEILGKNISETIIPDSDSQSFRNIPEMLSDFFNHPDMYLYNESENIKKSGDKVWVAWNNRLISHADNLVHEILCVGTDITARKKAEDALKESERKYRFLFEDSPSGSIIIGTDGLLKDVNKSFLESLGYSRNDLIGKKAIDIVVPSQQLLVQKRISGYFQNLQQPELDVGIFGKTGAVHYIRFSGKSAVVYESESMEGILLTGVDVTQRKEMEELNRNQQEKLVQADKMATLGILVSGVAHEINNPNNFILLNSTNLSDIWKDLLPKIDKYIELTGDFSIAGLPFGEIRSDIEPLITGISEGAERIRRIVQSLKDFARKDSGALDQIFNINDIIDTSIIIMNNLIKKSTDHFQTTLSAQLPNIRGNFQQIEQVIINLVTNACQALTDKRQIVHLSTRVLRETGYILIEVHDQGKGIAPEHRKHIFDPFFTTKRDCGGTGLGLSISYSIIKDHHGELLFESTVGKGTTFRLLLPTI